MQDAGVRAQLFACFVLNERYPGGVAERTETLLDALDAMIASTDGELQLTRTRGDLSSAFAEGPRAAILGLEGADPLEGKAENVRTFFDRGMRDLIFAWHDNPFSGTAFGKNTPLTAEGERLLGLCEELGIMVDVSHLSDQAFQGVLERSTKPLIASHSNCRAICPSARNLTDDMIGQLSDRGGVMGINLSSSFLSSKTLSHWQDVKKRFAGQTLNWREKERLAREIAPTVPRPPFGIIVAHVKHAIDVGGEDCVGFGGDLDGIVHMPEGMDGVQDYPRVAEALLAAGLTDKQVAKVCYGNMQRVFLETLPA